MRKTKKVVIRLDGEQHEAFKTAAKVALFSSISEWVRVTLLNSIGGNNGVKRGVGRPELSPEEKAENKLKRDFEKEVNLRYAADAGTHCEGSEKIWELDTSWVGKFPEGKCEVCTRTHFGLAEEGGVRVRRHKDNNPVWGDTEKLGNLDEAVERTKRKRKDQEG